MNKTFSLEQLSKTGYLHSNLILRQGKFDFIERFMEIKAVNPKLRQNQIRKEIS